MTKLNLQQIRKDFQKELNKGETIYERWNILDAVIEHTSKVFPKKQAEYLIPKLMIMFTEIERQRTPIIDKIYAEFRYKTELPGAM